MCAVTAWRALDIGMHAEALRIPSILFNFVAEKCYVDGAQSDVSSTVREIAGEPTGYLSAAGLPTGPLSSAGLPIICFSATGEPIGLLSVTERPRGSIRSVACSHVLQ
jgi:hypothetical protein